HRAGPGPSPPRDCGATGAESLGREFSPARADCGCRAPLPPRLARSAADPSASRVACGGSLPPIGTRRDSVPVGCATVNETSEATSPHSAPRLRRRAKLLSLPALLAAGV